MKVNKLTFLNSVNFSQTPWQYPKGPFYKPRQPDSPSSGTRFDNEQLLYRLYLLFPKIAKEEIQRVYDINKRETLKTIDTLMYAEMFRVRNRSRYRRVDNLSIHGKRKLASQCARTCVTVRQKAKKINWRTITSGTVHNIPPDTAPMPQVQQVINNSNSSTYSKRLRQIASNVTFDYRGIKHAVFENVRPALKDIENTVPLQKTSTLDNPVNERSVLHQHLLADNRTKLSRDCIKMKLFRFGGEYRSEMINY